jgi:putative membrane protein
MSSAATVADTRVHPGTVGIRFLKDLPQTLIGLPALLALTSKVGWGTITLIALAAALVLGLTQWIAWSRFRYGLGASEVLIESGLFSRNRRSIPFERIQDLDIEQGPLHRLFGLAKVKVETGAGGKDEGVLDSVTLAEADRLRRAIRAGRTAAAAADGGVPVEAAEPESHVVFAMSPGRVLLSGLFNFSLVWVAGLFGLLQSFEPLIPFDIYDPGRWLGLVDAGAERFTAGAIAAVLIVALALGVVTGIIRTLSLDWNFRLLGEGRRLRRMAGLFTRREGVIPKRRVQLALVRTGPLRQALGISELSLQTLGSTKGQGGLQRVAPFARADEIGRVMAELPRLRLPGGEPLTPVSSRHILRTALRTTLGPALAILGTAARQPEALYALPLLPLLLVGAVLRRRFHRYGIADGLLFVEAGWWRRQVWAVPMGSAQSVSIRRSWLQRRLGLATLAVDTAGAPALGGPKVVDLPTETAFALRDRILVQLSGRRPEPLNPLPSQLGGSAIGEVR